MANYSSTNTGANIDSAVNQIIDSSTDLNVDSNTLVVDKSANNVGIGVTAPGGIANGLSLTPDLEIRGAAGTGAACAGVLALTTAETSTVDGDVQGAIVFQSPIDGSGTDAVLSGAAIWAEADATFSGTVNNTELVFATNTSAAATERMRIEADGTVNVANSLTIGSTGKLTDVSDDLVIEVETDAKDIIIKQFDGNEVARFADDRRLYFFDKGGEYISSSGTVLTLHAADTVTLTSTENSEGTLHWDGYNLRAHVADAHDCGTATRQWDDVYATNSTIQTSDRNKKRDIQDSSLGLDFLNKLRPVEYKFLNKTRKHYGLIAQEVEQVLTDNNIATNDFAPFIKFFNPDTDRDEYGFRYGEMVGILIKAVQELDARVKTLEG